MVVFDLDDTLVKEIDFIVSGFRCVLHAIGRRNDPGLLAQMVDWQRHGQSVFAQLAAVTETVMTETAMTDLYRHHEPKLSPVPGAIALMTGIRAAGSAVAVVTDGRVRTQRNKILAAGLAGLIDTIVISEETGFTKPSVVNFLMVEQAHVGADEIAYIADNPSKDFRGPNRLGWRTIQVEDDGRNIHSQAGVWPVEFQAEYHVSSLGDIRIAAPQCQYRSVRPVKARPTCGP